jgi:hypothetical protein
MTSPTLSPSFNYFSCNSGRVANKKIKANHLKGVELLMPFSVKGEFGTVYIFAVCKVLHKESVSKFIAAFQVDFNALYYMC